ncbi:hypothetical protein NDU88_001601 [Pleurodeles waltl]|uniref:Gypsy retrotransposon integrase-like protein 1 n=1 Tax=Pleurodeles waltl TaxID=8319 RepID=A0AAV7P4B3_PLEWA|nr:hypothetical protein NDU88_001601 [Pleurodeles waltl]
MTDSHCSTRRVSAPRNPGSRFRPFTMPAKSEDGCFLKALRLVLPANLRSRAVALTHGTHQGIIKSKNSLWSKVLFPGLDQQVEEAVRSCTVCQASGQAGLPAPVITECGPTAPWQRASADFGSLTDGSYMMIIVDDYSRYPEVEFIRTTAAANVIPKVEKMMASHGLFGEIRMDNRPPFSSHEWAEFLQT